MLLTGYVHSETNGTSFEMAGLPKLQLVLCHVMLLCCLGLYRVPAHGAQPATTAIQELYVKPTENTSCPDEPCHLLDQYVQNTTQYFVSNIMFAFLPGNHSLSQSIIVSGVTNLALVAISGTVDITCLHNCSLMFTEVIYLTLQDLTLSLCGTLVFNNIGHLEFVGMSIELPVNPFVLNGTNIVGTSVIAVTVMRPCIGYSITLGYDDRTPSSWQVVSRKLTLKDSFLTVGAHNDTGSEMIQDSVLAAHDKINSLFLELHQSAYAVDLLLENVTASDIGLQIIINSSAPNNIAMEHLHFKSTQGSHSIMIHEYQKESTTSVHICNCHLSLSLHVTVIATQVAIENLLITHSLKVSGQRQQKLRVSVKNVTFSNLLRSDQDYNYYEPGTYDLVLVHNVNNLTFIDCKFRNNNGNGSIFGPGEPVVTLIDSSNIRFSNCGFSDNNGSPIASFNSSFTMLGTNAFRNNQAYKGGAMALYGNSYVTFSDYSDTLFVNNSAETVGGAIYVDYGQKLNTLCFFELQDYYSCHEPSNYTHKFAFNVSFHNNTAGIGGHRIYGASFDLCRVHNHCEGWKLGSSVFHINRTNNSDLSAITSDPLRACLCDRDGRPSCTTVFSSHTHYPGEPFQLSAVVVGDWFGTVSASVYAQLLPLNSNTGEVAGLGSLQQSQGGHLNCANLTYTIRSNSASVTLVLTAGSRPIQAYPSCSLISQVNKGGRQYNSSGAISHLLRSFPVFINVTLHPCPLGFMLSGEPYQCTCNTQLHNHHIPCNLTTQTVQRSGTEWVNASFQKNVSDGVIVNMYCPNDYCKSETVDVNLKHPDTQCDFNRSGILCGGCQSGLSQALGSAQCLPCSNSYLALLIPFALAGAVLILFMKLLNLTVAQGTLNGLIFYANIVRANQVAWIPGHNTHILTVFIAWLNLDLGIETCFYDGLDAYWKTWLQFVFPLYIWTIMIVIIILSRYFSLVAKFFGNNSVPILATLFLLSYSKLLRTCISILQSSTLKYPHGTTTTVWSCDGNIPYFSPKRVPQILVTVMVLLFLWLPYTGFLIFAQCLQGSNFRVATLLVKLKPVFDAYFGPLKDKHRYWVGLLLLVRGILFAVYAATPTGTTNVDLLATAVAVLVLTIFPNAGYYQKYHVTLLETSFLVNLGLLTVGTLYINTSGGSQAALASTSVGIAFVQFVALVLYHAFTQLKATGWIRRLNERNHQQARPNQQDYETLPVQAAVNNNEAIELYLSLDDFREPVLKYVDNQ